MDRVGVRSVLCCTRRQTVDLEHQRQTPTGKPETQTPQQPVNIVPQIATHSLPVATPQHTLNSAYRPPAHAPGHETKASAPTQGELQCDSLFGKPVTKHLAELREKELVAAAQVQTQITPAQRTEQARLIAEVLQYTTVPFSNGTELVAVKKTSPNEYILYVNTNATESINIQLRARPGIEKSAVEMKITNPDGSTSEQYVILPLTREISVGDSEKVKKAAQLLGGATLEVLEGATTVKMELRFYSLIKNPNYQPPQTYPTRSAGRTRGAGSSQPLNLHTTAAESVQAKAKEMKVTPQNEWLNGPFIEDKTFHLQLFRNASPDELITMATQPDKVNAAAAAYKSTAEAQPITTFHGSEQETYALPHTFCPTSTQTKHFHLLTTNPADKTMLAFERTYRSQQTSYVVATQGSSVTLELNGWRFSHWINGSIEADIINPSTNKRERVTFPHTLQINTNPNDPDGLVGAVEFQTSDGLNMVIRGVYIEIEYRNEHSEVIYTDRIKICHGTPEAVMTIPTIEKLANIFT
ncbi:MAG: hypothetical protein O3A01_04005 [bacterium]|nr:hypothetical protein [bacterium]